jgi:hypothetical protein
MMFAVTTAGCKSVDGVITAQSEGIPVCAVPHDVQSFTPCPTSSSGSCSFTASNFASVCAKVNGFIAGTPTGTGLPICVAASL